MSRVIVVLWGREVGVIDDGDGIPKFAYYPEFRRSGLEISPLKMPLSRGDVVSFKDLARKASFMGLPGVFADSLPDSFGNKIIENYFRVKYGDKGKNHLSNAEKLLYVGDRGMGALEYRPAYAIDDNNDALDISMMVSAARRIIRGDLDRDATSIMHVGESAGGARSKALVGWNPRTNEFIAGTRNIPDSYEHWILKIDGTDGAGPSGYGRSEYAYALMAKEAGIMIPETRLLQDREFTHFMIKRFDRKENGQKIHMSSLSGLIHSDFNEPKTVGYEDLLNVVASLTKDKSSIAEAFRRMVFNILARNQDDHVKNISFLMEPDGKWRLSPAYDLTFAVGQGVTSTHQMTVNGKAENIHLGDMMAVADRFEIPNADILIAEVRDGVAGWRLCAGRAGVAKERIDRIDEILSIEIANVKNLAAKITVPRTSS